MRSRHIQRQDGEGWHVESRVPFQITCCDCGLVHTLVLVAGKKGAKIGIAAKRDNRCTGQRRRQMGKASPAVEVVKRLRAACNGHPAAKIPWPHRLLHEAADLIEKQLRGSLQGSIDAHDGGGAL